MRRIAPGSPPGDPNAQAPRACLSPGSARIVSLSPGALVPQSVFGTSGCATAWDMMCEPEVRGGFALMSMQLSEENEMLLVGGKSLAKITPTPILLNRSFP